MKTFILALATVLPVVCYAQTEQTARPKRLYVEERLNTVTGGSAHCDTYGNCYSGQSTRTRDVSLEVTRDIMKRCPNVLVITDNRDAADFDLRISPGSSTLYKHDGDVVYVSPTRFKVSNLAKDVCDFVAAQK